MSIERDFSSDDEAFTRMFPIHRACRDGDVGALLSLYQHHTHLTTEDSHYGWTPIHWAAHCGQLECVIRLVQMGCDVNTVSSRFNQTPTHTAALGGHPRCVLWLSQAGADVNRQDFVGEAPIHKAARAASMECIQVLLIAGAKLHLRNSSGQTAADLARTHGSDDCLRLIANLQEHLLQLSELQGNGERNVNSPVRGPGLLCRKRLQSTFENSQMKKARREVSLQMPHSELEDSMESNCGSHVLPPRPDIAAGMDSVHPPSPVDHDDNEPMKGIPACDEISTRLSWQQGGSPSSHDNSADLCGSLHLTGSPNGCVSHRPELENLLGADYGEFLLYGHYHGYGDTAEELSDRGYIGHKSSQNVEDAMHLCQDA
ncbi:ankyrin repeat domain-containing protein 10-like isoform X1 [Festucalex cinctus]